MLDIQQNQIILRIILILFSLKVAAFDPAAIFIPESDRQW